jgi:hypothetical protein
MTPQAQLVLLLWFPLTIYFFRRYKPREAVIISFLGGVLFLPQRTGFALPLIPDYQGSVAACYGIAIGVLLYDSQRLSKFKFAPLDIPMLVWCICPIFSSLSNDLGLYDGVNEAINQSVVWGLPYFVGRLYFNNLQDLKFLAESILKGGLIYVPLCLWEGLMSPNLHLIVYGYYAHPSGIRQAIRYGGYRPNVFMQHGLMVGMWMMLTALICIWLWQSKTIKTVWNYQVNILVPVVIFTVIWARSTGAYGYFFYGLIILFTAKFAKNGLPLIILVLGIFYFVYANVNGTFQSHKILDFLGNIANEERLQSLQLRWENEEFLAEKARERIIFGWGGWGRNRIFQENWLGEIEDVSVTDSLWIIAFGIRGMVGLYSLTLALLLPPLLLCFSRYSAKTWLHPQVAPTAVLAVGLTLFMLDSVINNMFNPIFPLISGGLTGLLIQSAKKAAS